MGVCVRFSRAKGKKKIKQKPTKYIGWIFKIEILKAVQTVVMKINKTINHRLENMGGKRGLKTLNLCYI